MPGAFGAELMAAPGVDYICIDQQHGLIDYAEMIDMLRAIEGRGAVPFTRVPANEPWLIGKALDAGVQGIVVPMVNSAADAARAVSACRYGQGGVRSYGPLRASMTMDSRETDVLGGEVLCFVMVETREALDNLDQIAATPGLDGIYIGPADLALGLGLPPDLDKTEPEHVAAVDSILDACRRHSIIPGIQCGSGKGAFAQVDRGFRMVTFAKDSALLTAGLSTELTVALGESTATKRGGGYV
ncbi:HpcH/HpaI aldolase family protein [Amorphus sp. MBR-141]